MTRKIFGAAFLQGAAVLLLSAVLFFGVLYRYNEAQVYTELSAAADYAAAGLEREGAGYLSSVVTPDRITWIAADGTVRYDSAADAAAMENHLSRPEVQSALQSGSGRSTHVSATLLQRTLYYARLLDDGTVLRISCTRQTLTAMLSALLAPFFWILALVLLVSGVLSYRLSRQITKPLNDLNLDEPGEVYPELTPLAERLREQKLTIRDQMDELRRRQQEFTAISDNMTEGFLLLDRKLEILSCNQSATRLLGLQSPGSLRDGDRELVDAAESALSGRAAERLLEREGRSWQLLSNPVTRRGQVTGAVMLLLDVTEREQREQLRREFTANVSHELKTPLTSISGFAELIAAGLTPPDKTQEFAGDIRRESRRLLSLVEDILDLARLDEGGPLEREDVELHALAAEVLESLRPAAEAKGVTLSLCGEEAVFCGVRQILREMVANLCDNAIKYNRPGGSVTVTVEARDGAPLLTVADTGIGIPFADQGRVFERFYRVDKSHSKEIGGTGLGLSIVKHGAQYHGARVLLESRPGEGSVFSLVFPA